MHSAWFYANVSSQYMSDSLIQINIIFFIFPQSYRYEGYQNFLANITALDDVWVVPVHAGLEYRKNPMTNDQLINNELPAFNCDAFPQIACDAGSPGKSCE